jgi:hypothetical protein
MRCIASLRSPIQAAWIFSDQSEFLWDMVKSICFNSVFSFTIAAVILTPQWHFTIPRKREVITWLYFSGFFKVFQYANRQVIESYWIAGWIPFKSAKVNLSFSKFDFVKFTCGTFQYYYSLSIAVTLLPIRSKVTEPQ